MKAFIQALIQRKRKNLVFVLDTGGSITFDNVVNWQSKSVESKIVSINLTQSLRCKVRYVELNLNHVISIFERA